MSTIFSSSNFEEFFFILSKPFNSMPEFLKETSHAVRLIADELYIAMVSYSLDSPNNALQDAVSSDEIIIFRCDNIELSEQKNIHTYTIGNGGTLTITFTGRKNHEWTDNDEASINIISHQIFSAGTQVMTSHLISQAVTTNLLVKLPNTTGFYHQCNSLISTNKINQYDAFYFNIKNFKYVNNVLPLSLENDVLRAYSDKLKEFILPNEYLAHFGGDNFGALILKERASSFLSYISNLIIDFYYEDKTYNFTFGATVGASHLDDINDPRRIMVCINGAYVMARHRHHLIEYYSDELYSEIINQKNILAQFKPALNNNEFLIYYQPKVNVNTKMLCGAEALVRWKKNDEIISPLRFIPILEKDGSICELDFYVLDSVCRFLRKIIDSGIEPIQISTNFSRYHLTNKNLANEIVAIIDKYSLSHNLIEVEITESEDFRDYAIMERLVRTLSEQGITTSIDDFGTGYSSLNMLKKINLNLIKIDKSFIPLETEYLNKDKDFIMFRHIVSLADALGMNTIAEGVETYTQFEYLKDAHCDMVQGYLFDKPLPEEEFIKRLKNRQYS